MSETPPLPGPSPGNVPPRPDIPGTATLSVSDWQIPAPGGLGVMQVIDSGVRLWLRLWCPGHPHALVLEDERGFKALGRSWQLTSGRFLRVLGILFLAGVIAFGAGMVIVFLEILVPGSGDATELFRTLIEVAFAAAVSPLAACVLAVLYLDLLVRVRGGLGAREARNWLETRDPS